MYNVDKYKDIHKGDRAFLVGLGPSLSIEQLDLLKDEITFSSNKIFLSFQDTKWRPKYYSITDLFVAENNHKIISDLKLHKIFSDNVKHFFSDNDIDWIQHNLRIRDEKGNLEYNFARDLNSGTYRGGTIIYFQMQLAFFMGIKEIYLLGVDFSYENSPESEMDSLHGKVLISKGGEKNHFHPDYRKKNEKWSKPDMERQLGAFNCARLFLEKNNVKVVNLTPGTKLDVFPKNSLSEILKK